MEKVLITGVTGFIGNALARKCLSEGMRVCGVGRNLEKLGQFAKNENFTGVVADFSEYRQLESLVSERDFDTFFHTAVQGNFGAAMKDYDIQIDNIKAACDALTSAQALGCRRFVYVGTSNEFEIEQYLRSGFENARYSCIHSAAKFASEITCKIMAANMGIEYCGALLAMCYGPGSYAFAALPNVVIGSLIRGIAPKLIEGDKHYDLLYIDDAVEAIIAISRSGHDLSSYYVGHRNLSTFRELFESIRDHIAPDIELLFGAYEDAPVGVDYAIINRDALTEDTGFECHSDFARSLEETVAWLRANELRDCQ